ncbi:MULTISPECIES: nucleotide sugar dehydrogenase [unclassified Planococcus (in: firmicutes)]|uniref:nucleotide sugar dehydrogenase n=1 Tax=unclassified Planococcus (in: firmicutes) TaxID=2662419 RepID=UPI000C7B2C8B|nr:MULTISPECIES: nucleotide sugar dehydrogenase [unclassified Planococcus (in: firmicutes)]PKG44867.1 UDP-N-acetyl-D-mannosamine dehydrogenase [Planococcus sp. Urea-trap-24]PKG87210.1 UDP-N-acetyl-D-mannosamine dehydrogenase [Planococcus sp. Urea-3u-39]PKH42335.1 UDP-N-acetyl-D-mannosamine dehydrogenase [Planococcus sp. MB-3u-09]
MEKICVVGLGYIGLPTAVMFANHGYDVHGVDVNQKAVDMLSDGQIHIEEPFLQDYLNKALEKGTFSVSTKPAEADMFIIAVPSPIAEDKTANMDYIRAATESIVPFLKKGDLVVLESTVPPRTVLDVMMPILVKSNLEIGTELFVSHSPERVIPGKVFEELVKNDRIIGGINEESSKRTQVYYESFVKGEFILTDATTAEMVKVMENTYRDVNIAFANEIAKISDNVGVDAWEAIRLANHHPRVNIHLPGPGVGGHCIAVDPWFLVEKEQELSKIIHLSRTTNDGMPQYTADKIDDILKDVADAKVAVFGLSFKGNIDDIRESPSMEVLEHLKAKNLRISSFDPHVKENKAPFQTQSYDEAVEGADLIVILTDHKAFKEYDPKTLGGTMRHKAIFDTKNAISRETYEQAGFTVYRLGDGKGNPKN